MNERTNERTKERKEKHCRGVYGTACWRQAGKNVREFRRFLLYRVPLHPGIYLEDDKTTPIHGSDCCLMQYDTVWSGQSADVSEEHTVSILYTKYGATTPFRGISKLDSNVL